MTTSPMDGAVSPVYPQAANVARAVLSSLSYHKHISPDDIRQRSNWLHGARLLASALNDQAAAELLQDIDLGLMDIAASQGHDADLRAALGALMERVMGQGQEARA